MIDELTNRKTALVEQSEKLMQTAQAEQRGLTDDETQQLESALAEIEALDRQIELAERVEEQRRRLRAPRPRRGSMADLGARDTAEADELRAYLTYMRTGDQGAARELRADVTMTSGTSASPYGGYAIPTPLYARIIAKREETALYKQLGVQMIPGRGTTVNVPVEAGASSVWAATSEGSAVDTTAPELGRKPMTLAKYTKPVALTDELLIDEDARLLEFIADNVARSLAKTHNQQLVTVVTGSGAGTDVTLGAAAAASAGDIEAIQFGIEGEYAANARLVMRRATHGKYVTAAAAAWSRSPGSDAWPFGVPVHYTGYMSAIGAGNISMVIADWTCVGLREDPDMFVLRDPYSKAANGILVLRHYARFVYAVLDPTGVVRGKHPAS